VIDCCYTRRHSKNPRLLPIDICQTKDKSGRLSEATLQDPSGLGRVSCYLRSRAISRQAA